MGKSQDRIYRGNKGCYAKGIGNEWRCPECGSVFLVVTGEWGYVYKGRKYCTYRCLRAAQNKGK